MGKGGSKEGESEKTGQRPLRKKQDKSSSRGRGDAPLWEKVTGSGIHLVSFVLGAENKRTHSVQAVRPKHTTLW